MKDSFSGLEYAARKKLSRRDHFLDEIDRRDTMGQAKQTYRTALSEAHRPRRTPNQIGKQIARSERHSKRSNLIKQPWIPIDQAEQDGSLRIWLRRPLLPVSDGLRLGPEPAGKHRLRHIQFFADCPHLRRGHLWRQLEFRSCRPKRHLSLTFAFQGIEAFVQFRKNIPFSHFMALLALISAFSLSFNVLRCSVLKSSASSLSPTMNSQNWSSSFRSVAV
jgi:hypothetical protein